MDGTFTIEFAFFTSSAGPDGASLRVIDSDSRTALCDVRLTADQFMQMIRGGVLSNIEGGRSPHLHRVGKKMETDQYKVPREVTQSVSRSDCEPVILDWVKQQDWHGDWDVHEPRATNAGWIVVTRRWVAS